MTQFPDDVSLSTSSSSPGIDMMAQTSGFHIAALSDSDTASDAIPSETSDDRAFILSDSERLSYFSSTSSEASTAGLCPWCSVPSNRANAVGYGHPCHGYETNALKPREAIKLPLSSITRRIAVKHGLEIEQYLVLWASWE